MNSALRLRLRFAYSQPPAVSPAALKKLIDERNEACKEALDK
jgi:hypothetical protein